MRVKFTFSKKDQSKISLIYKLFNYSHSQLWFKCIQNFIESKQQLTDIYRIYNFNDYLSELTNILENCNTTINQINQCYSITIPNISIENLQEDINYAHTFFAESEKTKEFTDPLWTKLNEYLHALEIIERGKNKNQQGQVFCCLFNAEKHDLPEESYHFFTTKKNFGYCYANYPHIGRHLLEMYNAKDEEAHNDHIVPMSKISGDFYLWFGNDTPELFDSKRMLDIEKWFYENNIDKIIGMTWGNPHLAIGWLPVAKIDHSISKQELYGLCRIDNIEIID